MVKVKLSAGDKAWFKEKLGWSSKKLRRFEEHLLDAVELNEWVDEFEAMDRDE